MEWNAKSPSQWDWEHLFFCNGKATENPKLQPPHWSDEANGETNVGLFDTSGGSGCSESELIHASSSRSSKSASINSSSNRDSKTSVFIFESSQDDSSEKKELSKEEPVENSHVPEPSSVSGEPLLTLKLGKRLYFEDACPGGGSKNISSSGAPVSSLSSGKKCKSNGQNAQNPRCQVEGCGLDLSSAKDYHRKHRVCESHSKSSRVVIAGLERRFCQQCSRFHALSEFDEKKRSCRRRLSDHNARRRKPHPQAVPLNQSALTSSPYVGRQQMSPFPYSRTAPSLTWQDLRSNKLPLTKDYLVKPVKTNTEIPSIVTMLSGDSNACLTSKGVEDSITSSDPNVAQDFHRALSLLSTNSWASYETTKSISIEHSNHITQPMTAHATNQPSFPLAASTEYWHANQQPVNSSMWITNASPNCNDSNRFHEFQLFREPYESGFPYDEME